MFSYMSAAHIHSWGKISINFDIWDKSRDKYHQHQGRKAGEMSTIVPIFQMFHIKHHRNAEPCRTGIWGRHIANGSKYLTKCGICCQSYVHTFITFSRKKGLKAMHFILLRKQWCKKISLFPHTLVFLWEFCPHAHIIHSSLQRQPVPFP